MEVEFLRPQIWPGQVSKRNAVLQVAKQDSDWVMTFDADWRITGDRKAIRAELAEHLRNNVEQLEVDFVTPDDPSRPMMQKAANEWHVGQAGTTQRLAFIYRSLAKMEYRVNHWSLYCEDSTGRKLGLFGAYNDLRFSRANADYLRAPHCFEHLCLFRERKQLERNSLYILKRDEQALQVGYET